MNTRHILTFAAALFAGLLLAGCAHTPEPEELRESLEEVTLTPETAEPAPEAADLELDALECTRYLTITVRGTGEPSRGQLLSPVARSIAEARPDQVLTHDLDYPADTDVKAGGSNAVAHLTAQLNLQAESCNEQGFILLGYSQGALIIGDALAEPATRLVGEFAGELTQAARERVLAVVLYGDPRFNGDEPYNVGNFETHKNGILPRPDGTLAAYADRLRDYCVARDFICQSSFDLDEQGHVAYYDNGMQQDGAAFVITRMDPPQDLESDNAEEPQGPDRAGDTEDTENSEDGTPELNEEV